MTGAPTYSDAALAARDVFFTTLSDVHFFVEDEDQENLYETIFSRLFPKLKRFEVFPLRGKKNVLAHAQANRPSSGIPKRVYVLDKDFDDLLGIQVTRDDIFYLDVFCVENALVDESSLVQVSVEESPKIRRRDARSKIAYQSALELWMPSLDRVHRAFFVIEKFGLGLKGCDSAPEAFSEDGRPFLLCEQKISAYVDDVVRMLIGRGTITRRSGYARIVNRVFGKSTIDPRHVSGKFLLRLFYHHLRRCGLIKNVQADRLMMRFSSTASLSGLEGFAQRVHLYIS